MLFDVSSDVLNVVILAKFHVDRLRGFWAAGSPKVPFHILIERPLQQSCTAVQTLTRVMAICGNIGDIPDTGCEKCIRYLRGIFFSRVIAVGVRLLVMYFVQLIAFGNFSVTLKQRKRNLSL